MIKRIITNIMSEYGDLAMLIYVGCVLGTYIVGIISARSLDLYNQDESNIHNITNCTNLQAYVLATTVFDFIFGWICPISSIIAFGWGIAIKVQMTDQCEQDFKSYMHVIYREYERQLYFSMSVVAVLFGGYLLIIILVALCPAIYNCCGCCIGYVYSQMKNMAMFCSSNCVCPKININKIKLFFCNLRKNKNKNNIDNLEIKNSNIITIEPQLDSTYIQNHITEERENDSISVPSYKTEERENDSISLPSYKTEERDNISIATLV